MFVKSLKKGRFWNIKVALFKISNSDSLGVNSKPQYILDKNLELAVQILIMTIKEKLCTVIIRRLNS